MTKDADADPRSTQVNSRRAEFFCLSSEVDEYEPLTVQRHTISNKQYACYIHLELAIYKLVQDIHR